MYGAWHFVHGHSGVVEDIWNAVSIERKGWGLCVIGKPNTVNWVHFAIPSNAMYGWRIDHLHFQLTAGENARFVEAHLWDGDTQFWQKDLDQESGKIDLQIVLEKEWPINRALGVSIKIEADGAGNGVFLFHSVGANFRQ